MGHSRNTFCQYKAAVEEIGVEGEALIDKNRCKPSVKNMAEIWMGATTYRQARKAGDLKIIGDRNFKSQISDLTADNIICSQTFHQQKRYNVFL